jgi:hypothetical protein
MDAWFQAITTLKLLAPPDTENVPPSVRALTQGADVKPERADAVGCPNRRTNVPNHHMEDLHGEGFSP